MRYKQWFFVFWLVFAAPAYAERLKDIASIAGVRDNQLLGYGLVVGLDGSGDKTPFTAQTFKNMMARFGITMPDNIDPKAKNIAAVSVHATLPPFAKRGQRIDITVSSIGNAKSLRGGSLLMTGLKGADGNIYAVAQGDIVAGGFDASGADGSRITVNVPVVGRVPGGATVEKEVPTAFAEGNSLVFNLHQPDFTTAKQVTDEVNRIFGKGVAYALDAGSIQVAAPQDASQRVTYLSVLENIQVKTAQGSAKVIINSRTGTIVIGQNVVLSPAAITHGSLSVTISENSQVSQPEAFAQGQTVVTPESNISVEQEKNRMFVFDPGVTLEELVRAVNQVGVAPGDLMAILEALKQAGALQAELVVI